MIIGVGLFPSCSAEDSQSRERFKVFFETVVDRVFSSPQLHLSYLRTRLCGQKERSNQLTLKTPHRVAKPTNSSLGKLSRYTSKMMAAPQFHSLCASYVGCFHFHKLPASFRRRLALATFHIRGPELHAPLSSTYEQYTNTSVHTCTSAMCATVMRDLRWAAGEL